MLRVRVAKVVKLLEVELNDGPVRNHDVRAILVFVLAGHNPLEELPRLFNLASKSLGQRG